MSNEHEKLQTPCKTAAPVMWSPMQEMKGLLLKPCYEHLNG